MLASIEENAKLYDALGTALGPNLSVRIGDLAPEQRWLITDRIERSQPAYMRSQGFMQGAKCHKLERSPLCAAADRMVGVYGSQGKKGERPPVAAFIREQYNW